MHNHNCHITQTACIEKRGSLGGTCLNVGCIPSKALLHTSHMLHQAQHEFAAHGLTAENVGVDLPVMMTQKEKTVTGLTSGIEGLFKKNKVDYIKGHGTITGPNSVTAELLEGGSQTVSAKNIIIATGSEPVALPFLPVDEKKIVTSTGALSLEKIPETLTVIGGGVIGLELGSVWARLGSKVTVVEFAGTIGGGMDEELSKTFKRSLEKQGLKFKMNTKCTDAKVHDSGVTLTVESAKGGKQEQLESEVVLVAIGRKPYTSSLGLDSVGLKTNERGQVDINDQFQTSVPSIYAIGDAVRGAMLAHKAEEEGVAVAEQIASGDSHVNYNAIPGVIYTHPEVAWVGKNEQELKAEGVKYSVGKFPFMANSRARANQDVDGSVKVLTDAATDKILGVHIVNAQAGELIAEAVLALEYGASSEDVARTSHAHPTLSEAIKEAMMAAHGKPIHM